uniref:Uncharacterized protein n=1 Tax=Brassica oleracea var. oleracea TaxID=109376 RepID=A0A0D3EGW8_BRAOL
MSSLRFVAIFFHRISLLYPRHHHLFDHRRCSTLHLCRSRSSGAPLVVVNSSSPFVATVSHAPLASPPPRSFSPLLSMLPEAPNLLSWRVNSPDLLASPSQTTIAIGGASFILAIFLFCSALSRTLSPSLRHNLSRSSS